MYRFPTRRVLVVVVVAVAAARGAASLSPGTTRQVATNLVVLLAAGAACAVAAHRAHRAHPGMRLHLTLVALATGSWALGQAYWTVAEVILEIGLPYPSPADLGYVLFLPLMLAAVIAGPAGHRHRSTVNREILDAVAASAMLLFVLWTTVLHGALEGVSGGFVQETLGVTYPSADVLILSAVAVAARGADRRRRPCLGVYGLGLGFLLLADGAFAYLTAEGAYATGSWADTGWVVGFSLLAVGAALPIAGTAAEPGAAVPTNRMSSATPIVAFVASTLAAVSFEMRGEALVSHPFLVGLLAVVVGGASARSIVTRSEGEAYAVQLSKVEQELRDVLLRHELATDAAAMSAWWWTATDDRWHHDGELARRLSVDVDVDGLEGSCAELLDAVAANDRGPVELALAMTTTEQPIYDFEFELRDRAGRPVHLRTRGRAVHDASGRLQERVGVLFNVTETRRARLELQQRDARIAALSALDARAHRGDQLTTFFDDALMTLGRIVDADACEIWQTEDTQQRRLAVWSRAGAGTEPPAAGHALSFDVRVDDDRQWGTLLVFRDEWDGSLAEASALAHEVGNILGATIARAEADAQLRHDAHHDALTGLPNRAMLTEHLSAVLDARPESIVAVAFLDLDRFKTVNDRFGHPVGDELLVEIGARLRAAVRPSDLVARLGGDEFAVVMTDLADALAVGPIVQRFERALVAPFELGETHVFPTASVGLATTWETERTVTDLLRNADLAMYVSKARGRSTGRTAPVPFEQRYLEEAEREGRLADDLRVAVARGEFTTYYQPVVDLRTGATCGVEALVRWDRPGHGIQPPDAFLDTAYRLGMGDEITAFMLGEACRWTRAYLSAHRAPGFTTAVNISPRDLLSDGFVAAVADALDAAGLEPDRLCLEITEAGTLADVDDAVRTLLAVRALGVKMAIDDFGTGYSSMRQLKSVPIDIVKIDRGLIEGLGTGLDDSAMVAGMITMAHKLSLDVVAEGVATEKQREVLVDLGCEMAQGYLFGHPEPADLAMERAGRNAGASLDDGSRAARRPRHRARTVVLADDLEDDRRLLARQLARHGGFRVVGEAEDGSVAADLVRDLRPDLVLLDLQMPRLGGLGALQRIREESPATAVVILSGYASPEEQQALLAAGATACIEKGPRDVAARLDFLLRAPHDRAVEPARRRESS